MIKLSSNNGLIDAQKTLLEGMRNGKLDRLCPNIQDGVIYVGGRASKAIRETWNQQDLILLPYDHRLSRLIAENELILLQFSPLKAKDFYGIGECCFIP